MERLSCCCCRRARVTSLLVEGLSRGFHRKRDGVSVLLQQLVEQLPCESLHRKDCFVLHTKQNSLLSK